MEEENNGDTIQYDDLDDETLNRAELWIGFGLKPELTGIGLGYGFVSACVEFAVTHSDYKGEYIRLGVAIFNKRAIKVYERVGFEIFDQYEGPMAGRTYEVDGRTYEVTQMQKKL